MKYLRGSEWNKWDLHIHTPSSICQKYGGKTNWDKYIEALERLPKDVKVIGITDYYFIDGYEKIMQYKNQGRLQNIEKIFPNLEFRIDIFGSGNENNLQKINLHIIFDLNEDDLVHEIKKVRDEFISKIPITGLPKHVTKSLSKENLIREGGDSLKQGFNDLIPPTKKVLELLDSPTWRNKTFLLLGYKEWSNLDKNSQLKPFKEYLYNRVHAFLTSNSDTLGRSQTWLNKYGQKILLHSGDIHDFTFLDTAEKNETGEYIKSVNYNCNTWIKANPTFEGLKQIFYEPIERVKIQPNCPELKAEYQIIESVNLNEEDFWKQKILFNPNLNTIIGGRSTGKSTLLNCIAGKIDISKIMDNDFIQKHLDGVTVNWKDSGTNQNREIDFFPQNCMIEIAKNKKKIDELIEKIIKEKDKKSLLLTYHNFLNSNRNIIAAQVNVLFDFQKNINELNIELKEIGNQQGIEKEIKTLEDKLAETKTKTNNEINKKDVEKFNNDNKIISELEQKISFINKDIEILTSLISINLMSSTVDYQFSGLTESSRNMMKIILNKVKNVATQQWQQEITNQISNLKIKSDELSKNINGIRQDDTYKVVQNFLKQNDAYKELQVLISEQQKKLMNILELEKNIRNQENQKNTITKGIIHNCLQYRQQTDEVCDQLRFECGGIEIYAYTIYDKERLSSFLQERLNLRSNDRQVYEEKIINNYGDSMGSIINEFIELALEQKIEYKGTYADKSLPIVAVDFLSTNWFQLSYKLTYENDEFPSMSQGKQAFVILKLLLEFSNKKCPILIDQPEDSLDNRAIYHELVEYLKQKKKSRQIIIVTHNPNIVVGADAEEVIVANQNGKDVPNKDSIRFQYMTGGLEYSKIKDRDSANKSILEAQGIRQHVCEILEGGNDAFIKREKKYDLVIN